MRTHNKINITIMQRPIEKNRNDNFIQIIKAINNISFIRDSILVLHELSYLRYFCIHENEDNKKLAISTNSSIIQIIKDLAIKKNIFIVFPFFEKSKRLYYNSVLVISPKGKILGKYRKINLPNELCYHEKYYFDKPTDIPKIINIGSCKIGLMICWDQWHSSSYKNLVNLGADFIICPTSIGSAFKDNKNISLSGEKNKWLNVIKANSLMNNIPVIVANRIGKESYKNREIRFWGSSFICNANGDLILKCKSKDVFSNAIINLNDRLNYKKDWNFSQEE